MFHPNLSEAQLGRVFLVLSAVCYSTAGLFVQLIDTSVSTMLCVRGFVAAAFIFGLMLLQDRDGFARKFKVLFSKPGALAIVASVAAMYFNLSAYQTTSVANVVVIYSSAPFLAAIMAWALFDERLPMATLGASVLAMLGTIVLMTGSLGNGNLKGDVYALCMTICMALMIVAVRWGRANSMVATAGLSALASAIVTLPFADFRTVSAPEIWLLVLFGVTQLGLGILFLTLGARHVSASQSTLIGALDVPLAPLWVWFAFGAIPPSLTFVGGAIVLCAVFGSLILQPSEDLQAKESSP